MRIYLISHYAEDGSEEVRGTVDRDGLPGFIADYVRNVWFCVVYDGDSKREERVLAATEEALDGLPSALECAEKRPGEPFNLMGRWGGLQLHAIDVTPEKGQ